MESLTSVDKSRIKHAFQKALNSYDEHALIQQKMNIKLIGTWLRVWYVECIVAKTDFSQLLVI